jgi:hypothetical protein
MLMIAPLYVKYQHQSLCDESARKMAEAATLLTCIQEVTGLNLGYPD